MKEIKIVSQSGYEWEENWDADVNIKQAVNSIVEEHQDIAYIDDITGDIRLYQNPNAVR